MKYFEKQAATYEVTEKDLTNKQLQKQLRTGYFSDSLANIGMGGILGGYFSHITTKKVIKSGKGILPGVAAGLIATPIINALNKKDVLKEIDRRKEHKGYR